MSVSTLELQDEFITVDVSSNSAYLGLFTLRPLGEKLTVLTGGIYSRGSNDYSGISVGMGLSYHLSKLDTLAVFGHYVDNDYGTDQKLGLSYRHEF